MNPENKDPMPTDNVEDPKQDESTCCSGCSCHAAGPISRIRWIVGAVIILAAGALVAKALIKNHNASAEQAVSGSRAAPAFAALPIAGQTPAPVADAANAPGSVAVKELGSLNDLNTMAADTSVVFVYLPGKNEPLIKAPMAPMRSAAKTIAAQGHKIGLFMLKIDSPDYAQLTVQIPAPSVLAMVKGGGMIPVSGDITEAKLIQGFVAASSSGSGCGPSGCGPSGCN